MAYNCSSAGASDCDPRSSDWAAAVSLILLHAILLPPLALLALLRRARRRTREAASGA
jgi:hypothetical protein